MEILHDINNGNVAFMVITTVLVFLMTPGLAFFYGGLVERKNSLTMMYYSFVSIGIVTALWVLGGFSLVFGEDIGGVIGNPMDYLMLRNVDFTVDPNYGSTIPFLMFFMYQLMFAIITAPLMTGAFANRMSPGQWITMQILWMIFVYFPVAHWVWGNGFLAKMGFVDYAGGTVIHATAGFSSLVAILILGKRADIPQKLYSNLNLVLIGAALLMIGWFGFNSGGALSSGETAAIAFTNTGIAGAFAMVTWMVICYYRDKKFSFIELVTGAVAGLATITPAAGYVTPQSSVIIGILAALVCFCCVRWLAKRNVDDALGVWGVHGMGGAMGTLYIGVFAYEGVNSVSAGWDQFLIQLMGLAIVIAYSMLCTYIIMKITNKRVPSSTQVKGLDQKYIVETEN